MTAPERRGRRLTQEERDRILSMLREGTWLRSEIARAVGIHPVTVRRWAEKHGFAPFDARFAPSTSSRPALAACRRFGVRQGNIRKLAEAMIGDPKFGWWVSRQVKGDETLVDLAIRRLRGDYAGGERP